MGFGVGLESGFLEHHKTGILGFEARFVWGLDLWSILGLGHWGLQRFEIKILGFDPFVGLGSWVLKHSGIKFLGVEAFWD